MLNLGLLLVIFMVLFFNLLLLFIKWLIFLGILVIFVDYFLRLYFMK